MDSEFKDDVPTVLLVADMVEKENGRLIDERGGFEEDIFALSLVNTYAALSKMASSAVSETRKDQLFWLGMSVWDPENYEHTLLPGVIEVLDMIKGNGDMLKIYTKGPKKHQRMKLEVNGLLEYFPHPFITRMKNASQLDTIVDGHDKDHTYKVGNSVRSDVNPATAAGIRAIYIPREEWLYEQGHNGIERKDRVVRLESIRDLQRTYPLLDTEWDSLTLARQEK